MLGNFHLLDLLTERSTVSVGGGVCQYAMLCHVLSILMSCCSGCGKCVAKRLDLEREIRGEERFRRDFGLVEEIPGVSEM